MRDETLIWSVALVVFVILVFAFAAAAAMMLGDVANTITISTWPSTPGQVTRVTTNSYREACAGPIPDSANCRESTQYIRTVEFKYTINGVSYQSNQAILIPHKGSVMDTLFPASPFPNQVGQSVTVYYSPNDPKRAVITREISPDIYCVFPIIFMSLMILGLCLRFVPWSRLPKRIRLLWQLAHHHRKWKKHSSSNSANVRSHTMKGS